MKKWLCILPLLLVLISSFSQTKIDTVYSSNVKDRFVILVRKPAGFSDSKNYHHVYLTDGTIGIGDYVLGKDKYWAADIPDKCLIIAIGHLGDWSEKRSRDLI